MARASKDPRTFAEKEPGVFLSGCLRSKFGNFSPKANTLLRRLNRGVYRVCNRPQNTAPMDHRGPVVRTVGMTQTFLTPSEVEPLVADYEAGAGVQELAGKYASTAPPSSPTSNVEKFRGDVQDSTNRNKPRRCACHGRACPCEPSDAGCAWTARPCGVVLVDARVIVDARFATA